ncbi:hypothetical protein B0I33_1135 [Prauserella shujinwangii]|uniref:Uncharacterized protein n=1 Tax=Prauserella shujinwangii TaxID=1453103 RepID=A0A2T0LLD3_9PSEU|nr:hypothetical protein [Prauserella shujinwangii]PRX43842.1 hypothetical protein B0I33_1135 [Prauserella shujinwangii]
MGIRDKFQQFKQDWAASREALEDNMRAGQRRRERSQAQRRGAGGCATEGCARHAAKDGYCLPCWAAIFGGA